MGWHVRRLGEAGGGMSRGEDWLGAVCRVGWAGSGRYVRSGRGDRARIVARSGVGRYVARRGAGGLGAARRVERSG